jgi:hypothetical protein
METLFKLVLSAVVLSICAFGLRWIWTHQLDFWATVNRATDKVIAAPDWVATRDPKKIYQEGNAVGDVSGSVSQTGETYLFSQLVNTGSLNKEKPFEYQRVKLRVVRIERKIEMKVGGPQLLTGVLEGVECQKIN